MAAFSSAPLWGIVVVMTVLFTLAVTILVSLVVHSRKKRELEGKFKLLFSRVFDSLVLLSFDGKVIDANESACTLLGYTRDTLLTKDLSALIPRFELARFNNELTRIFRSGMDFLGETTLITSSGKRADVEAGCTLIRVAGRDYVLTSFRDTTERKKIQNDLREKNAALREIMASLEEEKVRIKNEFARTIDQVLLPTLAKVRNPDGSLNDGYLNTMDDMLRQLSHSTASLHQSFSKLTPRQIEICDLIKSGATTKEVARMLNISELTVSKHRERIRKRLVITKKDVKLGTFLKKIR